MANINDDVDYDGAISAWNARHPAGSPFHQADDPDWRHLLDEIAHPVLTERLQHLADAVH